VISDRKGVNVPDAVVPVPALTEKDRRDLAFALEQGADWIALSFVQRPEDVAEARKLMGGYRTALMAKIEKPAAVHRLDEIIELADGIMVARGDLGVELNPEEVPPLQKRIVAATRRSGKPVVVATQMLESMIESPAPTRAEVSDVANAVYDGADAVMLSAETASGAWPVEAVTIMDRIAAQVEAIRPITTASTSPRSAPMRPPPTRLPRPAPRSPTVAVERDHRLHRIGIDRAARRARTPGGADAGADPQQRIARRLALLWGTSCRPHPRHRQLRGDDRQGQAHGAAPRASARRDRSWSPWPGCRSARRDRPTCSTW
jgi:pyruvate kinase